eukprot:12080504-Alexandrium_andersonii.AAC.1
MAPNHAPPVGRAPRSMGPARPSDRPPRPIGLFASSPAHRGTVRSLCSACPAPHPRGARVTPGALGSLVVLLEGPWN